MKTRTRHDKAGKQATLTKLLGGAFLSLEEIWRIHVWMRAEHPLQLVRNQLTPAKQWG